MDGVFKYWCLVLISVCVLSGCGDDDEESSADAKAKGKPGTKQATEKSSGGFNTPLEALDALGKAMVAGDTKSYRRIAAKDADAIKGLDALIAFDKTDSVGDQTLKSLAPNQGFGVSARRFPAEINGDRATIVQLFERKRMADRIHFRKFIFSKNGGRWFLVDSEFGSAAKLPPKLAWANATPVVPKDGSPKKVGPSKKVDPSVVSEFIPADAFAAVVIHPRRATESELAKALFKLPPVQGALAALKVTPSDIERVVFTLGIPSDEHENDCNIVYFRKAIVKNDLLDIDFDDIPRETAQFRGATYYREKIDGPRLDAAAVEPADVDDRNVANVKAVDKPKPVVPAAAGDTKKAGARRVLTIYPDDRLPRSNGHADRTDSGNWLYQSSHTQNPSDPGANLRKLNWHKRDKGGRYESPRGKMGNTDPHIGYALKPSPMSTPPRFPALRWSSRTKGTLQLAGHFRKSAIGGNGVQALIFVDGEERFSRFVGGNNKEGIKFEIEFEATEGTNIDFVVDPKGSGTRDDTYLQVTITAGTAAKADDAPKREAAKKDAKKTEPPREAKRPADKKPAAGKPGDSRVVDALAQAVYFPNDFTLISGTERQIRDIIAGRTALATNNALAKKLKATSLDNDLVVVSALAGNEDEVADVIKMLARDIGQDDVAELSELTAVIKDVSLSINLAGPTLIKLEINTRNDKAAEEISAAFAGLVAMLKQARTILPAKLPAADGRKEIDNPLLKLAEQVVNGTVVQQPGSRVLFEVQLPKSLTDLVTNSSKWDAVIANVSSGVGGPDVKPAGPNDVQVIPKNGENSGGVGNKTSVKHRVPPKGFPQLRDLAIKSHDCRVFFPATPKFNEDIAKIPAGDVHVATFEGQSNGSSYVLEIYTYPKAFVDKMGAEKLLDQTRATLVDAPRGKLLSTKRLEYQGLKALDFVYQNPNTTLGGNGYCRVVVKGNRVWLLEIDSKNVTQQEVAAFHNSLVPYELPNDAMVVKSDKPSNGFTKPVGTKRQRIGVPDEAEQQIVRRKIDDAFKISKARSPKDRAALLTALIDATSQTADASERFVMLLVSRDLAVELSNMQSTVQLVDQLTAEFDVDTIATRSAALAGLAKARVAINERLILADHLMDAAEQALRSDVFDTAVDMLKLAQGQARLARELIRGREIGLRLKEVERMAAEFQNLQPAFSTLATAPDDSHAAALVGKFRCFAQGSWAAGLKLLAKGDDPKLKTLASSDLKNPPSTAGRIALGDQWWDLSELQTGAAQKTIKLRAAFWYQRAAASAKGLDAKRIETRLAELAPVTRKARSVNMLKLIDLRKHVVKGTWRNFRGTLVSTEEPGSRVVIPYDPPDEYDLSIEFERKTKENQFVLGFKSHGVLNMLMIDYRSTSQSTFFSAPQIDVRRRVLVNDKKTKLVVAVRKESIMVTIDGKKLFHWTGQTRLQTNSDRDWLLPKGTTFFVGSTNSAFQIHSIKLE
jgi:hypothetical protein